MAEKLDLRQRVLMRWLGEPSAEYSLTTLETHAELREVPTCKPLAVLLQDGFVRARRRGPPWTCRLTDPVRAGHDLESFGVHVWEGERA